MSDSPRPSEMSLSIKIGEHAVDVAGPIHEVWKVLEVFQRLSGIYPATHVYDYIREEMLRKQQLQQQMMMPPYIYSSAGGVGQEQPAQSQAAPVSPDPYVNKSALWKALNPDKKKL